MMEPLIKRASGIHELWLMLAGMSTRTRTVARKILFVGGHSRVGLLATPKLDEAGHAVTSVIRNPDHVGDVEASGASVLDRDAAVACIDGLERLRVAGGTAPRIVMVSCTGSIHHVRERDDPMYVYTEAKKAADRHLLETALEFVILGPASLTMDPARGLELVENRRDAVGERTTSRELVADAIVEMAGREQLPEEQMIPFVDGDTPVSEL